MLSKYAINCTRRALRSVNDPDAPYDVVCNDARYALDTILEEQRELKQLLSTARLVVKRWNKGDLAEAVRKLDALIKTIDKRNEVTK